MGNAETIYNEDQLWDTFPGMYEKFGTYWGDAKTRWTRILKGMAVVIAFLSAAALTLIFMPFNFLTCLIAGVFIAIAGIGWGQARLNYQLYVNDGETSVLLWQKWDAMGGDNYGIVKK